MQKNALSARKGHCYLLLFYFPAYAVLAVFDDDMHRFELVADRVSCRPIPIGACLGTLCDQFFDLRYVDIGGGSLLCIQRVGRFDQSQ